MKTKIIAVVSAALLLSACDNATSGNVETKQSHPAYTTYDYAGCMFSDSKTGVCYSPLYVPRLVPECYELNFYNKEEDEYGHACVDKDSYKQYTIGMHYPDPR